MCDRNVNTWFGPRSSSNFLRQRKITYVDNPFDEQASASMLNYDLTYLNRPAKAHETAKKELSPSSSRSGELFDEDNKDGEREEIWNFSSQGDQSCEMSDWSYLFAPVQCYNNSPNGEIQLSLSYDPLLSTLKVAIIKARGLTCPTCSSKSKTSGIICVGTFIDISLLSNNKQVQTKRTEMKTRKTEIFFYERFSFLVCQEAAASKCSLRCRAVHKVGSLIKRDHVIGQVVIGSEGHCSGDGLHHWEEVMGRPKKNVTQWHLLKEC